MEQGIRHLVLFCLKHKKDSEEVKKFLSDGREILSNIPGVEKFEVLLQISKKNDYQYGFCMEFGDQAAYDSYNGNPQHIDFVIKRWEPEVEKFMEIDFEQY